MMNLAAKHCLTSRRVRRARRSGARALAQETQQRERSFLRPGLVEVVDTCLRETGKLGKRERQSLGDRLADIDNLSGQRLKGRVICAQRYLGPFVLLWAVDQRETISDRASNGLKGHRARLLELRCKRGLQ